MSANEVMIPLMREVLRSVNVFLRCYKGRVELSDRAISQITLTPRGYHLRGEKIEMYVPGRPQGEEALRVGWANFLGTVFYRELSILGAGELDVLFRKDKDGISFPQIGFVHDPQGTNPISQEFDRPLEDVLSEDDIAEAYGAMSFRILRLCSTWPELFREIGFGVFSDHRGDLLDEDQDERKPPSGLVELDHNSLFAAMYIDRELDRLAFSGHSLKSRTCFVVRERSVPTMVDLSGAFRGDVMSMVKMVRIYSAAGVFSVRVVPEGEEAPKTTVVRTVEYITAEPLTVEDLLHEIDLYETLVPGIDGLSSFTQKAAAESIQGLDDDAIADAGALAYVKLHNATAGEGGKLPYPFMRREFAPNINDRMVMLLTCFQELESGVRRLGHRGQYPKVAAAVSILDAVTRLIADAEAKLAKLAESAAEPQLTIEAFLEEFRAMRKHICSFDPDGTMLLSMMKECTRKTDWGLLIDGADDYARLHNSKAESDKRPIPYPRVASVESADLNQLTANVYAHFDEFRSRVVGSSYPVRHGTEEGANAEAEAARVFVLSVNGRRSPCEKQEEDNG